MDFVVGLPQTFMRFDAVWVIVERLTKSAHFIPVMTTYSSEQLAWIYIREIQRLHGVPVSIISYRVELIQERLRTTQSRQKGYAYRKARDVAHTVGEKVLLGFSPMKGVMRFRNKGMLSPRYIGPFEVLERVGEVAYRLALPSSLLGVPIVFHVSML
ncbi:uncharacterized protein [Nicotiana tomentosiformis]|uniref:uncharacterized protein n=1 Tax=Nicotiana tomentosiformis TaxID=4098 RepID=UPI00388CDA20